MTTETKNLPKLTLVEGQPFAIKMSAEQKDKWLNALRSGEYKQVDGSLRGIITDSEDGECQYGYCCLGVLEQVVSGDVERFDNDQAIGLPTEEWLEANGIEFNHRNNGGVHRKNDPAIQVMAAGYNHPDEERMIRASTLNDDGYTFAEIADLLEPLIEVV